MRPNKQTYHVGILGIRGVVGTTMLNVLKERDFPVDELRLFSSRPDACPEYEFKGRRLKATKLSPDAFEGLDIVLASPGAAVSREYAPHIVDAGAVMIDNTSAFRMEPHVPLVVPEVNPQDIEKHQGIIANPNCSTIQLVVVLKPLHDAAGIERVVVSTYQSVSGAGREAMDELTAQERGDERRKVFPHPIAHNLIPQIDVPVEGGYTKEEMKMVNETKKIMGDDGIRVTATCVRVPVYVGHSESVNIQTRRKLTPQEAIAILKEAPGVKVVDDITESEYPTPLMAAGRDETFVGRIREDNTIDNGLNLWIVADNLRKGAALNAVQIAEHLIRMPSPTGP